MNKSRGCELLARASGSVICPFNSILGLVAQLGAHHIRIVGVEGSNPFESTTASEQSPLCSGAFYFTGNRKHHPLRSLAPPFPNRTRAMHWASIWFLRGLTANRIIFGRKAQRSALWAGLCISAYDTWDSNPRALGNVPGARFNPRRPAPKGRSNPFESTKRRKICDFAAFSQLLQVLISYEVLACYLTHPSIYATFASSFPAGISFTPVVFI